MPRFFMHLRDGTDEVLDPEGVELPDLDAARSKALTAARDVLAGDVRHGLIDLRYRIDAEDEAGRLVYSLPFKHAFSIVPEALAAGLTGSTVAPTLEA